MKIGNGLRLITTIYKISEYLQKLLNVQTLFGLISLGFENVNLSQLKI
jgi:hypothetical protein